MDKIIKNVEQSDRYAEELKRHLFNPKLFKTKSKFPASIAQFATANDLEYIVITTKDCKDITKLRSITEAIAAARPMAYIIPVCLNSDNHELSFYQLMWGTYPVQEKFDFLKKGCGPFTETDKKQILLIKTEEVDENNVESYINMLKCSMPKK